MKPDTTTLTDEEIISSLSTPPLSKRGIEYLYKMHFESLSQYVMANNGSWQDAQDIFQEVIVSFIQLVQQNKFRGEASIKTFLYSMNRNIWLNELKKRGRSTER